MHWTSNDIPGLMLDVKVMDDGASRYSVISKDTGEILKTEDHTHPMNAMDVGKALYDITNEVRNAVAKN
jgi:hypothetical protein